jgi:predicted nucleotidyltransferase
MLPGAAIHEGSTAPPDVVAEVLAEAVAALDQDGIGYALMGGLASSLLGRPRCTSDIDLFVRPEAAPRALAALGKAEFETERTNPHWLYKAYRRDVLVDLIFKSCGDIYLDDEMLARTRVIRHRDVAVRVLPPEDLVVIKAIAHDEETPRHWHDALSLISSNRLDWPYLLERARKAPARVMSLLLYARSLGLCVPAEPLRALGASLFDA